MHALTDMPYIDAATFPAFDYYVTQFYAAFQQQQTMALTQPQAAAALLTLHFPLQLSPEQLAMLYGKYAVDGRLDFGGFMAICSYVLLCLKLMQKFGHGRGQVNVDLNGLVNLGVWFL